MRGHRQPLDLRAGSDSAGSYRDAAIASLVLTIYIDRIWRRNGRRHPARDRILSSGRKRVLVVLFIPSVERDGVSIIDQPFWVDSALALFGRVFGGATAFPKAKGIWRDDERGGTLVNDEPVVVHCYTTPLHIEIGLVAGDEYLAIRDFDEGATT
jgi:hypothetical protein